MPAFSGDQFQFQYIRERMRNINRIAKKNIFKIPNSEDYLAQYKKDNLANKPDLLKKFEIFIQQFKEHYPQAEQKIKEGRDFPPELQIFFKHHNLPTFNQWLNQYEAVLYQQIKTQIVQLLKTPSEELKQGEKEDKLSEWVRLMLSCFIYLEPDPRFDELKKLNLIPLLTQLIFSPEFQSQANQHELVVVEYFLKKIFGSDDLLDAIPNVALPALQNYLHLLKQELKKLQELTESDILPFPMELKELVRDQGGFDLIGIKNNLAFLLSLLRHFNDSLWFEYKQTKFIPYIATNVIIESLTMWQQLVMNLKQKQLSDEGLLEIQKVLTAIPTFIQLSRALYNWRSLHTDLPVVLTTIDNFPVELKQYWLPLLENFFNTLSRKVAHEFFGVESINFKGVERPGNTLKAMKTPCINFPVRMKK